MRKTEVYETTPDELANAVAKEVAKHIMDLKLQPKPVEQPVKTKELAEFFKVTPQSVWGWVRNNTIPHKTLNGKTYFFMSEVLDYLMENPKPSVDLDVELCEKYLPNYQK